jgi:hypothetical protein
MLVALGAAVIAAGLLMVLIVRQRRLAHRVGSFSCLWSSDPDTPIDGVPGIAQYGAGRLDWWRIVSLAGRPAQTWSRDRLEVLERRNASATDDRGRPLVRLRCGHGEEQFSLTMSTAAYAGLVSWLEARPRGARAL